MKLTKFFQIINGQDHRVLEHMVQYSARFWLKKLLAQVHATQNIYLHNIFGTCTKEGPNKENAEIAKYKKHSDLILWKIVEMSSFFEFLFILKYVTKKLHAQCACRLENLLAQRKKCMHLCKCACVKSSTGPVPYGKLRPKSPNSHGVLISSVSWRTFFMHWRAFFFFFFFMITERACFGINWWNKSHEKFCEEWAEGSQTAIQISQYS